MGFCISKYFSSLALGSVASFYCYPLQVARFSIFQFIFPFWKRCPEICHRWASFKSSNYATNLTGDICHTVTIRAMLILLLDKIPHGSCAACAFWKWLISYQRHVVLWIRNYVWYKNTIKYFTDKNESLRGKKRVFLSTAGSWHKHNTDKILKYLLQD